MLKKLILFSSTFFCYADKYVVSNIGFYARKIQLKDENRKSSYPYISADTFRRFCCHIFDETRIPLDPQKILIGDTIFVNHQYLEEFFELIHPQIKNPYVLITHFKNWPCPGKYENYLNDPKIHAWFSANIDRKHPKLFPLPLGLANGYFPHGNIAAIKKMQSDLPSEKNIFTYVNFAIKTNTQKRQPAFDYFKTKNWCTVVTKKYSFSKYLDELAHSYFVVSPEGSGTDCHRTWEALYARAIPILMHSPLDPLFIDLPVILINNWSEITEEYLKKNMTNFYNKLLITKNFMQTIGSI